MIGFYCSENTNALNAFAAIQDKIIIAKDGVGNAYLPDWDFNGIGDLERGYGYLIKVSEEISNYNICLSSASSKSWTWISYFSNFFCFFIEWSFFSY